MKDKSGYAIPIPIVVFFTIIGFAIAAIGTVTFAIWLAEWFERRDTLFIAIALIVSVVSTLISLFKLAIEERSLHMGEQGNGRTIDVNDTFKASVMDVYNQHEKIDDLFMFEQIPQQKLQNAVSNFAPSWSNDEIAILLYDNTPDGNCKDGILLTSKRLYCKDGNSTRVAALSSINKMTGEYRLFSAKITIALYNKKTDINIAVSKSRTPAKTLFNLLYQSIKFAKK